MGGRGGGYQHRRPDHRKREERALGAPMQAIPEEEDELSEESLMKAMEMECNDDEKCLRENCNGKIIKSFITNRSTFFCNSCQK